MKRTRKDKRTIYEDLYLMDSKQEEELIKDYLEANDLDINDYTQEQLYDMVNEDLMDCFDCDFGKNGNWKYSSLEDTPVVITGTLGLWDGTHEIKPVRCPNIHEAIQKIISCDIDYVRIYEDGYDNLCVDGYHHDGTNHFVIKKWTPKGYRVLHFSKEVFGC